MTASRSRIVQSGGHTNAFGFLRLFFASLVIVSHSAQMKYGDSSHDVLTKLFGSITAGELAVDFFFAISGYLIAASFLSDPDWFAFLKKRVARIYPAFIVASLFSLFVVTPLAGVPLHDVVSAIGGLPHALISVLLLQAPDATGIFARSFYPELNGSMWTIAYEFRCYLLILVLGLLGVLRQRWLMLALTVALIVVYIAVPGAALQHIDDRLQPWLGSGEFVVTMRLTPVFLLGTVFTLFRNDIAFTKPRVAIAIVALCLCLHFHRVAHVGIGLFGGYIVFAIAMFGRNSVISRINNRNDISYGVYLYAWPIGHLLIWYYPAIPTWLATLLTLVLSFGFGWASWHGLEKRAMRFIRHIGKTRATNPASGREATGR